MYTRFLVFLNSFFTIIISFLCSISYAQSDVWIDKNENENYTARHECSFVQAGDSFILFGGREKAQQLDIYNFKTDTWSVGQSAPKEFNHFQATYYKGFIWVIGSFKTNEFPKEIPAEYIWLYHVKNNQWIKGPKIPVDRQRGGAGLVVYKDKFYLLGGNTIGHSGGFVNWFDEYDPVKNTWTILENAPNARDHFNAAIIGDTLYAIAGRHSGGKGGFFAPLVKHIDTYNFTTKKWATLKEGIPTPRAAPATALFNEQLFIVGGEGENKGPAYKLVEVYNPKTTTWTQKKDIKYPRHGTQAIVSGQGIYITGGSPNRGGGNQLNMEVYNKDKPKAEKIKTTKLKTPKNVSLKPNSQKNIYIKSTGGNTGNFIHSITINGVDKNNFKINSNTDLTLLNSGKEIKLTVEHLGTHKKDSALINIIYNGSRKKTIPITIK